MESAQNLPGNEPHLCFCLESCSFQVNISLQKTIAALCNLKLLIILLVSVLIWT